MRFFSSCFKCWSPAAPTPTPTLSPFPSPSKIALSTFVTNTLAVPAHLNGKLNLKKELEKLGSHGPWITCPCLRSGFKMNLSRSELNKTFTLEKLIAFNEAQQLRFIQRANQTIKSCDSVSKAPYLRALLLAFYEILQRLSDLDPVNCKLWPKVFNELNALLGALPPREKRGEASPTPSQEENNALSHIVTIHTPNASDADDTSLECISSLSSSATNDIADFASSILSQRRLSFAQASAPNQEKK